MSDVQTQAMPSMTLPATKCFGEFDTANRQMHQIQAMADTSTAKPVSTCTWLAEKPAGLGLKSGFSELRGISTKRVEEVAAVATQVVISPSPQTTCPAT